MRAFIYIEGGGESKDLRVQCRQGFRSLLERCGFSGRMPRLVACGRRSEAYSDFKTAHHNSEAGYVGMLIDSEETVNDPEKTWDHLKSRDSWDRPAGANDEQVLFMTTCMETWIISDRNTLRDHYGSNFQESTLPPLTGLEERNRHHIQEGLERATRGCSNAYRKGRRSFEVLAKLKPETLECYLDAFRRVKRILDEKLK